MKTSEQYDDQLLVKQFQSGNAKAFKKLFETYWEPMFLNAKTIIMDGPIAQDIVQNVWISIWNKRTTLDIDNFQGYLYKAVRYGCYRHLKSNKFNKVQLNVVDSLELETTPEVEKKFELEEAHLLVQNSLKMLTPRCRQIFKLSRIEEIKNDEIARLLGISRRSVENQISIALKTISHHSSFSSFFFFLYFFL